MVTAAVKPHIKTLAASGAPLYVLGNGRLVAQTPNFTVRIMDETFTDNCVLSAAKFSSFISKAGKDFNIHQMENGVRLISGSLSVDFPALDSKVTELAPNYISRIPTDLLKELLIYASAVTDAKATMTYAGVVHLLAEQDIFEEEPISRSLRVLATDGYRALRMDLKCSTQPINLSIPATLVAAAVTFTDDVTEIADEPNYLAFRSGTVEAIATKFAVKLPDIAGVFSGHRKTKMGVDGDQFKNVLGNLSPFLDTKTPDVVMSFQNKLMVSTGSARDEIEYTSLTVPNQKFQTPAKYLTDFLSKTAGSITLETDSFDRILFTNGNRKYLLAAKV